MMATYADGDDMNKPAHENLVSIGNADYSQPVRLGYCARFCWEWKQPFFGLKEQPSGECIDIAAAFSPRNYIFTLIARVVLFSWALATLVQDFVEYAPQNRFLFMGYLTHWGFVLVVASLLTTLACSIWKKTLEQPPPGKPAHFFLRLSWFLFSLTLPIQIVVVALYWALVYDGEHVVYLNAMKHGGLCILLFVDGFVLGNIPIRIKQVLFSFTVGMLYGVWLLIHSYANIGNGDDGSGEPDDDDLIYNVINWKDSPTQAAIVTLLTVFVVNPLMFFLVWTISLGLVCCKIDGSSRKLHMYHEEETRNDYHLVTADNEL